jgi:hypothetical protein
LPFGGFFYKVNGEGCVALTARVENAIEISGDQDRRYAMAWAAVTKEFAVRGSSHFFNDGFLKKLVA